MKLTEEQKRFIIIGLATFDTPSVVAKAFREEFGFQIDRRHVANYDVEKRLNHVSEKLQSMFWAARANFIEAFGSIPIAHRAFRLRRLNQIHDDAFDRGNYVLAAAILEQAAKEAGDVFTNTMKLRGNIKHDHEHQHIAEGPQVDFRAIIDGALRNAAKRADGEAKP